MKPEKLAAAIIVLAFFFLALALLTSCVAIPVPPFGDRVGDAGTLHLRVTARYEPRVSEFANPSVNHAWDEFFKSRPKTLGDK